MVNMGTLSIGILPVLPVTRHCFNVHFQLSTQNELLVMEGSVCGGGGGIFEGGREFRFFLVHHHYTTLHWCYMALYFT